MNWLYSDLEASPPDEGSKGRTCQKQRQQIQSMFSITYGSIHLYSTSMAHPLVALSTGLAQPPRYYDFESFPALSSTITPLPFRT